MKDWLPALRIAAVAGDLGFALYVADMQVVRGDVLPLRSDFEALEMSVKNSYVECGIRVLQSLHDARRVGTRRPAWAVADSLADLVRVRLTVVKP